MNKYIILQGIAQHNRFFSLNTDNDPTKLSDGTEAYVILGYAETVKEAQIKLFGRSTTELED